MKHLTCEEIYGVDKNPKQASVDIRFLGLLDEDNRTVYSATDEDPDGIYMPVLTSSDEDVATFNATVARFSEDSGIDLTYEIPGASSDPRVTFDDNNKKLVFNSAVSCGAMFVVRKCKSGTIYAG